MSERLDDRGVPVGAPVTVTGVNISFGAIFKIAIGFAIAQAVIGAVALIILFAIGVL